jgi:hypothetical protein
MSPLRTKQELESSRNGGENLHTGEMTCLCCEDSDWVCENHPDQPWEGLHACQCGGAGMPCLKCNQPIQDEPPRLPKGLKADGE